MKIDSTLIVKEREQRAWSQQQLALVASLSVRTIQRMEKSGLSSKDSLQAIASAFDKAPAYFLAKAATTTSGNKMLRIVACTVSVAIAAVAALFLAPVEAETVALNIAYEATNLQTQGKNQSTWGYVVTLGQQSQLNLPNNFLLKVLPKRNAANEIELNVELSSQSGETLIPDGVMPVLSGKLPQGINISYEKAGKINLSVSVSAQRDVAS